MNLDDALKFNPGLFARAQERAKDTPLDLTPEDIQQLGIVSPNLAAEALRAQVTTHHKMASAALIQETDPPPAAAAPKKKPTAANLPLDELADAIVLAIKKSLEPIRQRLEAQEKQNSELSARMLEAEAQLAVRGPVPRDT